MDRRRLAIIFVIVFVDVLGFGLILPLLPYYAKTFGANAFVTGLLTSSYAAASVIGSPILGRMSDRFGRRPILLFSIAGTCLGYLVIGWATTLWMLFLGRVIDGLTAGNISVAQSYITDVTDEKSRARGLGLTGAAFGLGFIIGPTAGGLLSRFGYNTVAFVAAGIAVVNLMLVALLLPESLTDQRKAELAEQPRGGITMRRLVAALKRPRFGAALTLRSLFWFAFAIFQTTFALWAIARLDLTAQATGLVLGYVGLMSVLVQGVFIGPLTKRFSEGKLIVTSLAVAGVSLAAWGFSNDITVLIVLLTPLIIAVAIQNTTASSVLSKSVPPAEIGGAFGLSTSLQSIGSMIAPALGGALLDRVGFWAPGVVASLIVLGMVPFAVRNFGTLPTVEHPAGADGAS